MPRKVAFITGSSSGLGTEICQYLLEEGFHVYGASRRETPINDELFFDLEVDITNEGSVAKAFDQVESEVEGIDLLINNAAVMNITPFAEQSSEDFMLHLSTNVLGAFHILKYAYPLLIEDKSHIVTISSIGGKKGFPEASAYCASKFALEGMIQSLRQEWKEHGFRFTTLNPGAVDTPLWEGISDDFETSKMLDPVDFIHVFDMVINSPSNMQFPEISFLHKEGSVD
jgi:NAD(P)-dependent dehydrogenase (short-subunit alcohol dehydrogenase family)